MILDREQIRRWKALCDCASTEVAKPTIGVVQFLPGVAYATDSFLLGRLPHDLKPPKAGVLIPARPFKQALQAAPSVRLELDADGLIVRRMDAADELVAAVSVPRRAGVFPDIGALLKAAREKSRTPAPFLVRSQLMARVAALAPREDYNVTSGCYYAVGCPEVPVEFFDVRGELLGVVMPVRDNTPASVLDALDWPTTVEAAA